MMHVLLLLSVGLPVANAPDVLQPCGLLYYPWCLTLTTSRLPKRSWQSEVELNLIILDVPTFTTSRLPWDPSSQKWNYVGGKWPMTFAWNARLPHSIEESFTCRKSTTWDRQLYFPSEGRRAEDFFALKNLMASAGFEPANLGTKGQHATSRPLKPLSWAVDFTVLFAKIIGCCSFLNNNRLIPPGLCFRKTRHSIFHVAFHHPNGEYGG